MKNKLIIGGAILLLLVVLCVRSCKKEYLPQTFPKTLMVKNYTNNQRADTVTMIILNKIMAYDTMTVNIYKLTDMFDNGDIILNAHTVANPFEKHNYMIFMKNDLSYDEMKKTLAHELIHVKQMDNSNLSIFEKGYVWNKDSFNYKNVTYESRPYEIEAYNNMTGVKIKLDKLYEKSVFVNPFK
jgi:hypothetical protein